ncbi:hypothetical protein GCM10023194_37830 [Planotetraspora phitsanulokensis]|uniref:Uncharacterized protein n=1 Tax=Planotetraspora phitsanulokensis TaxID=575192 RepID=A0A8J3XHH1_9ACTN|nr:hypothetical protein [Planotetraspora phitsanulokensis]GII41254.1 hypothetical protein Pph01_62570 [Planotetraspora phitsanulokensis]
MEVALTDLLAATGDGLVDAQLALDERGLDSLDAFGETGITPTVLTWSAVRLRIPVAMRLLPKREPGQATASLVGLPSGAGGHLIVGVRYLPAEQGEGDG